jgi:threonine/homoserine/homoserine lactone efflux protein
MLGEVIQSERYFKPQRESFCGLRQGFDATGGLAINRDRMSMIEFAFIGGIWLSLLYSATVMPASVWAIQLTVSRGWTHGLFASAGLALGQVPWCLAAGLLFFQFAETWQALDLWLRAAAAGTLLWMAIRSLRAPPVTTLQLETGESRLALLRLSLWRSLVMPWRFPLWAGLVVSVGIHLRGPGWELAGIFTLGAVVGQIAWFFHFILIAGLFGKRVPEDISLRSLNKLRLLATVVLGGLALIILAPVAFPPAP